MLAPGVEAGQAAGDTHVRMFRVFSLKRPIRPTLTIAVRREQRWPQECGFDLSGA